MKDPLKFVMLFFGCLFLPFGIIMALKDAFDDYQQGFWGVVGGVIAATGFLLLYVRRLI